VGSRYEPSGGWSMQAFQFALDPSPEQVVVIARQLTTAPLEVPRRSLLAFDVPGFTPVQPQLYSTEDHLADKLCALASPPRSGRVDIDPGWHRFKDLFDTAYLIHTCPIDAGRLRAAIDGNANMIHYGMVQLPDPYELYGFKSELGRNVIAWEERYERMRKSVPQLQDYPELSNLLDDMRRLVGSLPSANVSSVWDYARGWLPYGSVVPHPLKGQLGKPSPSRYSNDPSSKKGFPQRNPSARPMSRRSPGGLSRGGGPG
jgi:hypothetical protein